MLAELEELSTYRLDRKLTFRELAAEMTAAGFEMPYRTLHTVLSNGNITPHETTLHQIRRFVEYERSAGRLPWPRAVDTADAAGQPSSARGEVA
jgi:hypothetical protein